MNYYYSQLQTCRSDGAGNDLLIFTATDMSLRWSWNMICKYSQLQTCRSDGASSENPYALCSMPSAILIPSKKSDCLHHYEQA